VYEKCLSYIGTEGDASDHTTAGQRPKERTTAEQDVSDLTTTGYYG
jgi:hypothetical protein